MDVFSPYSPLIFASIGFSLPVFYVLGAFFSPRLSTAGRNVAVRLAMGAVVFTFGVAVGHAGFKTMLLPLAGLFVFFFEKKPKALFDDLRALGIKNIALAAALLLCIALFEMWGADLRQGENIVVGNWDIAHNAGLGYEFMISGSESTRFLLNPAENRVYYHFSDLWISGFYAHYIGILPYYATAVVYRSIVLFIIVLLAALMFKSESRLGKGAALGSGVVLIFLTGIVPGTFGGFALVDMLWQCTPYLTVAAMALVSFLYFNEKQNHQGLLLTGSLPLLHPMLAITVAIFFGLLAAARLLRPAWVAGLGVGSIAAGWALGLCSVLFALIDGRMYSATPFQPETPLPLMMMFSAAGVLIAVISVLPYLAGIYFARKVNAATNTFNPALWMLAAMAVAAVVVVSVIGVEATQIIYIVLLLYALPRGSAGLLMLAGSKPAGKAMPYSLLLLALPLLVVAGTVVRTGSAQPKKIKNNLWWSDDEWQTLSTISRHEALWLRQKLFTKNKFTDVGIVICHPKQNTYTEQIFMARKPYLKAFLPGVEVHHLAADSSYYNNNFEDGYKRQLFMRSALQHFYAQNPKPDSHIVAMQQYLKPAYLLLDTADAALCLPEVLQHTYQHHYTTGRFVLVSQENK